MRSNPGAGQRQWEHLVQCFISTFIALILTGWDENIIPPTKEGDTLLGFTIGATLSIGFVFDMILQ